MFKNNGQPVAIFTSPARNMNEGQRTFVKSELREQEVNIPLAAREQAAMRHALMLRGIDCPLLHEHDPQFHEASVDLPDRIFLEDVGRPIYSPGSRNRKYFFLRSKMGVDTRMPEPDCAISSLQRLGVLKPASCLAIDLHTPGATLETGDMLTFYVNSMMLIVIGRSSRSNHLAVPALQQLIAQQSGFGNCVVVECEMNLEQCLHLTSGAGALNTQQVVLDPTFIEDKVFRQLGVKVVHAGKGDRGHINRCNCLYVPTTHEVLMNHRAEDTIREVRKHNITVVRVPNSQAEIVQGGLTCQTLRFNWYPWDLVGKHFQQTAAADN